jgi:hypothetical protein
MKLSVLCVGSLLLEAQGYKDWDTWKQHYGKNYNSLDEEAYRHEVFAQNMAHAYDMQKANPFAVFGSDEFSDWTEEEEKEMLFGAVPELKDTAVDVREAFVNMSVQIPAAQDWTGKATTPVKKQKCGSCWANSAVEQIESDFMLQKGKKFILSPQEAVDCKGDGSFRNGCNGGWPDGAYKQFQQLGGIQLEADYPDEGKDPKTKKPIDTKCLYNQNKAVVTVKDWQSVGQNDENKMKQYVGMTGPLSVCVFASFKGYKSGVLTGCPAKNDNHCMQVVGYGTDKGKQYWKVRNSWGPGFGEQGFVRLEFGTNQCNIKSHPTSTTAGKILTPPSPPTPPSPSPSPPSPSPPAPPTPPPPPSPPSPPSPGECATCKVCFNPSNHKCQDQGAHRPKTKSACEGKQHIWCGPSTFEEYV